MFAVFGVAYSFGAFFTSMAEEFGASTSATALVFSLTVSLSFVLGAFTGRWADAVGPRPVLIAGAVSLCAGLLLTAVVPTLWLGYLTYGVGVGFAVACGYVPMVAAVGGWFVEKRASALGFSVAGIGLGTLVGSPLAAYLIDATSWRTTYVIFGLCGGGLLLIAAAAAAPGPNAIKAPRPLPLRELLQVRSFAILYVAMALIGYGIFVPFVFIARSAEQRGIDDVKAALLVGLIGGASVIGRLVLGTLADRFGPQRLYMGSFIVLASSHLIWLVAGSNYLLLVVYSIVLGLGYGGYIALSPAVVAEVFGLDGLGGILGTLYTAAAVGSLTGPPIAGWLIDTSGESAAIIFALVMSGAATAVLLRLSGAVDNAETG